MCSSVSLRQRRQVADSPDRADVLVCFGTRPEAIKLSPVIEHLASADLSFKTLFTGQHDDLFESVAHLIPVPDYELDIMRRGQSPADVMHRVMALAGPILEGVRPKLVIVQGDTTSAAAVALSAFYHKIPVGHVEAGLRTHDLAAPFPEELNRQMIARVSQLNWAPTAAAKKNLEAEGCEGVVVTGNTVVDACLKHDFPVRYGDRVLVTLHRRENFGEPMTKLFRQIDRLASVHTELEFIFPMHPNPEVVKHRDLLESVAVVDPLSCDDLLELLSEVRFVISDSGGIQEECAAFRKKVLVCREKTERPEGVEAGFARTVGTDIENNFAWANDSPVWNGDNPYGDGRAGERIAASIREFLNR